MGQPTVSGSARFTANFLSDRQCPQRAVARLDPRAIYYQILIHARSGALQPVMVLIDRRAVPAVGASRLGCACVRALRPPNACFPFSVTGLDGRLIDLADGTTKRSLTTGTHRAAMVLRALGIDKIDPAIPRQNQVKPARGDKLTSVVKSLSTRETSVGRGRACVRGQRAGRHLMGFERTGQSRLAWSGATSCSLTLIHRPAVGTSLGKVGVTTRPKQCNHSASPVRLTRLD
jgi:hypothetical protein